jgi:hypothetical protein
MCDNYKASCTFSCSSRSDALQYKFCAAPKEAARVAVINPHLCEV